MIFSTFSFLFCFLPVFFLVYYLLPAKVKNYWITLGSILFYSFGEPIYIILLVNIAIANYIIGRLYTKFQKDNRARVAWLVVGLAINLGIFISCKIMPDYISSYVKVTTVYHIPLGISFYILSCISYLVDIYWGKATIQKNFISYFVYLAMFPKVLAGPVISYQNFSGQLENRTISFSNISEGILLFGKGLGKKVLLANNLYTLCSQILAADDSSLSILTAWLGILAIIFRFYFDFSGYTDMARGLAKMMGFYLPRNFRAPFSSRSVTEFWHRWNISIIRWFKRYIFYPLNGIHKGKLWLVFNLLIVIAAYCFWRGFGWNVIIAAVFYVTILLGERFVWGNFLKKIPRFLGQFYTFFMTVFVFVMLSHPNVSSALSYLGVMFDWGRYPWINNETIYFFASYLVILLICIFISSHFLKHYKESLYLYYPKIYHLLKPMVIFIIWIFSIAFLMNSNTIPFLCFTL